MMLTDAHKVFLQNCATFGTLEYSKALQLMEIIMKKENGNVDQKLDLENFIAEINKGLENFDQAISIIDFEYNDQKYVIFHGTVTVSMQDGHVEFNKNELQFFYEIIHLIATIEVHSVPILIILGIANKNNLNPQQHITVSRGEELLRIWCQKGYLYEVDGLVYLGPRTMKEFKAMLEHKYKNHFLNCNLCKDMLFKGDKCSGCETTFHTKCINQYIVKKNKCPECKSSWKSAIENDD